MVSVALNVLCCGRYRFKDPHFLNTLRSLLEVIYTDSEDQKDLVSLSNIHMMTSTHSLFLPTMLDSEEPTCKAKGKISVGQRFNYFIFEDKFICFVVFTEALVSLLLCLVKKCPAVCTNNHFVVLLGAYGVTLSALGKTEK